MAINNMMPPVQLKRPAAPVTDINKMIEDLNLQLTTPTVQQAAPQSTANVAEILKQQIADKLNEKIQSLTQGASLEEVTGAQAPRPQPPRSNLSRLRDETPIHGSTSGATTAFAKTAQNMNNLRATNEMINQDRDYKQYQDAEDLNRMIEKLEMQGANAREIEEFKSQERMKAQDAAFQNRMELLNARLESKGGGGRQAQPSIAPTAEPMTGEQLDMLLKANGITRAQWELMNPKQQQQMIPKLVGRNKRSTSDIIRDLSNLPDISLNPYVEVRKKELEAELAESEGQPTGGSETSGSRANSLLQKGLSGGTQATPPTQTTPAPTVPTDVQGNRQYTPEEIINIINATKGNMPNNHKIRFDKKKF